MRKFAVIWVEENFIVVHVCFLNSFTASLFLLRRAVSLPDCHSLILTLPLMHNNNSSEGPVRIKTTSAALVSANYTDSGIVLSGE